MKISSQGLALIKSHEGLRLSAYLDPVGVWTIGWGHTKGVRRGQHITRAEAEAFLLEDLAEFEHAVSVATHGRATQSQFDAMVSLAFNIGAAGFRRSTVLRAHNSGDYAAASRAFHLWNKGTIGGVKKELPGLVRRRADESALYLQDWPEEPSAKMEVDNHTPVDPERSMGQSQIVRASTITAGTATVATVAEVARQTKDITQSIAGLGLWLVPILCCVIVGLAVYIYLERRNQRKGGWA